MNARRLLAALLITLGLLPVTAARAEQPTAEAGPGGEIIGGTRADPGEYRFQVALLHHSTARPWDAQFCGGTLISPDTVLTAGHCVVGSRPGAIDVLAGTQALGARGGGQRVRARSIRLHPGYDDDTVENDIAIIQLGRALPFATVRPARPTDTALYPSNTMATTIGWGDTDPAPDQQRYPYRLREVQVPIVADGDCAAAYGPGLFLDQMVCAGDMVDGGEDACYGDSGGPLLVPDGPDWVQIGVVSTGMGCARRRFPGIYTEVSAYPFVQRYLDPDSRPDRVTQLRRGRAFGVPFVDWSPPFFDGGTRITRYRVEVPGLGRVLTVPGNRSHVILAHLPRGRHRVVVHAVNRLGAGPPRALFLTA